MEQEQLHFFLLLRNYGVEVQQQLGQEAKNFYYNKKFFISRTQERWRIKTKIYNPLPLSATVHKQINKRAVDKIIRSSVLLK